MLITNLSNTKKESVSSVEQMKKYIDFYANHCNVNNFIFRELMDYDKRALFLKPRLSTILQTSGKIGDSVGSPPRNSTILENLIKYHWNHLNISRVAWNDDLNKSIMKYNLDKEYCTVDLKLL